MHFKHSEALSFGIELELQLVSPGTGRLSPSADKVQAHLATGPHATRFALEATLATLEVNSSIHSRGDAMMEEMRLLVEQARRAAQANGCDIRGGGTQVTQFWNERVTAPGARAKELEQRFGFLPKRFSTYGMHVHVGMPDAEAAIRVANVLQALCPLFIALSAASPFLQLTDTGFAASRPLEPLVYPNGGPMPVLSDWAEFEHVVQELFATQIAHTLKDIYWDVRPKPEFGTVEVRVFDTPLSVHKAVTLAAYTRQLAALALHHQLELPWDVGAQQVPRRVSRFLACRDGMDAELFNPFTGQWTAARAWLESTIGQLERGALLPRESQWSAQLQRYARRPQDHEIMRQAWNDVATGLGAHDAVEPALVGYSSAMCHRLLAAPVSDE